MRTYQDIIEDFLNYMADTYNRDSFRPENYFSGLEGDDLKYEKGKVYQSILEGCYNPETTYFYFTKFIIGDLIYAGFPEPYRYNSLMYKIDNLIKQSSHVCVMVARGHGKSLHCSILEPIRRGFLFYNQKILLEGVSQTQVEEEVIIPLKKIITSNEALSSKIGKKSEAKWTGSYITYNGGYIIVRGFGSAIRGKHLDLIVVDDILRQDNMLSDRRIESFMFEELEPMITSRKGQIILVGTPKHPDDLLHTIMEKAALPESSWVFERFPGILNYENQEVLCPDRFTFKQLMQKKVDMGAWRFEKEMMCLFKSDYSGLFDKESITQAIKNGMDDTYRTYGEEGKTYYMGVDLARSGKASADYSVYTILEYNNNSREKKIAHILRWKGRKTSIQVDKIAELSKAFNNCMVLVEKNNIGQEFVDELIDNYNTPVETITTGVANTKYSVRKEDLVRFLISEFNHEKITIPYRQQRDREMSDDLISELLGMQVSLTPAGNERYEGKPHDDMVISLALANRATQGMTTAFVLATKRDKPLNTTGTYNYNIQKKKIYKGESELFKKIASGIIK